MRREQDDRSFGRHAFGALSVAPGDEGDAMEMSIVLEGKELGTISSFTRDRDEVGYPGLGKYFPFCAERCRLKGAGFPLSELDSGLYTFENKALRLEGDVSPATRKMAGIVL
jgi:hypothetical protein